MFCFPRSLPFGRLLLALAIACAGARTSSGVVHLDTGGSRSLHPPPPGDNSGWQYQGLFGPFLGTPIAPQLFCDRQAHRRNGRNDVHVPRRGVHDHGG